MSEHNNFSSLSRKEQRRT